MQNISTMLGNIASKQERQDKLATMAHQPPKKAHKVGSNSHSELASIATVILMMIDELPTVLYLALTALGLGITGWGTACTFKLKQFDHASERNDHLGRQTMFPQEIPAPNRNPLNPKPQRVFYLKKLRSIAGST